MKQSPSKLDTQNQMDRFSTSKSIVDEKDILKYFMRFDIIPCDSGGSRISIQGGQDQKSILKYKKIYINQNNNNNNNNYKCHTKTNYTQNIVRHLS